MDVLTGDRMRRVDEDTIARFCPGLDLMERAGRHAAEFILARFPKERFKASIFVGPGNNGGDALVVARRLSDEGRACSIHYLSTPDKFSVDAFKNYQRLQQRMSSSRGLREINSTRPDWANIINKDLVDASVIVDGLFGTGLSRKLEGRAADVVGLMNARGLPVVSIDVPSGIDTDTGEVLGTAVQARHTITMGYPKLGMLFHPAKVLVGEMRVADLGFPDEVLQVHSMGVYLLDRAEAARRLPARPPDAHKYRVGTVVVVAGSRAFTGAAALAAEAALRSGCGMVYAAVPESIGPIIQRHLREAVVVGLPETEDGTLSERARVPLGPYVSKGDALVIGPGLDRHPETARLIRELVADSGIPVILDADGITAYAGEPQRLEAAAAPRVLTPHSGELQRLMAADIPDRPLARVEATREAAKSLRATLVHKGAPTLVASAEGDVWVNQQGTSALATAGTGDVLAGMVAGLTAQGATGLDAATVACYLHGRAGSLAARTCGERGVIASDVLGHIGEALLELENGERDG